MKNKIGLVEKWSNIVLEKTYFNHNVMTCDVCHIFQTIRYLKNPFIYSNIESSPYNVAH